MKKIQLAIALVLLVNLLGCAQEQNKIVGDWVEVRREERTGYVYTLWGNPVGPPGLQLSFTKSGLGTFYNPNIPEPKRELAYKITGDSLLAFGKQYEIVKAGGDSLILIRRNINDTKLSSDFKLTFLNKEKYDQLSESQREELAAPHAKDNEYRDRMLEIKNK